MFANIEYVLRQGAIRLFSKYVVFAGAATIADMAILFALTEWAGMHYLQSAAVGYVCGMVVNYSLNKKYNFRNESDKIVRQFSIFAAVALVGALLNQVLLYVLVEHLGMWYLAAKICSVALVMFWSFFGHKNLTFKLLT